MTRQELIDKLMEWRAEEIVSRYLNTYAELNPDNSKKTRHEVMLENAFSAFNDMTDAQLHDIFMMKLIERAKRG